MLVDPSFVLITIGFFVLFVMEYFSVCLLYKKSFTHSVPRAFVFNMNSVHIILGLYCSGGSPVTMTLSGLVLKPPVASLVLYFGLCLTLVGLADQ